MNICWVRSVWRKFHRVSPTPLAHMLGPGQGRRGNWQWPCRGRLRTKFEGSWRRPAMPSRAPLRAVFFDLDDTLCDTIGTREARARRAFQLLAPAIPDLRETEFVKLVMEPTGDRIVRGVTAVVESLGLAKSPAGRAAAAASWLDLLCLMPGARQTLDTLRQTYLLGIITNGDSELQRAKCSA